MLEVGLGGIYDATNVVARPVATAIASISMDHMDFLGDRLDGIAGRRPGIIKPGVPCATGFQDPEALAVLERVAGGEGCARRWRADWIGAAIWRMTACGTAMHGCWTCRARRCARPHRRMAGIAITALRAVETRLADDVLRAASTSRQRGQRGCSGWTALAAMLPSRVSSCGWMASPVRGPGWRWRNTWRAGATGGAWSWA